MARNHPNGRTNQGRNRVQTSNVETLKVHNRVPIRQLFSIFLNIFVDNKEKSRIFAASYSDIDTRSGRVFLEVSLPNDLKQNFESKKIEKMTTKQQKTYEPIQDLEGEVWKPIKEYEGLYEVSNKGRVKSLNYSNRGYEKLLRPAKHKNYLFVTLTKYGKHRCFFIHRLVYEAFVGFLPKYDSNLPSDRMMIINHKDECGVNNNLDNLELLSVKENNKYKTKPQRIAKTLHKKVIQKTLDGVIVKEWESAISCEEYGFSRRAISSCCHGRIRTHKGYIWSFTPLSDNY